MSDTIVKVGLGSCGIAAGALDVYNHLDLEKSSSFNLHQTSCIGLCFAEPIVEVHRGSERTVYGNVDIKLADKIVEGLNSGELPSENRVLEDENASRYLKRQVKFALKNCGIIDPESIDEYIERDGYKALEKAVLSMSSEEIIEVMKDSGLKGRGGGGFLTGQKWDFLKMAKKDKKYLVCNADEGDPGAFMDRAILEGDPHTVIEGMVIAAFSTGASEGYVYCRAEYPLAVKRLKKAITDAENKNYLGNNILGTDFSFELHVKEGAGAFVCGEETALIASIEGGRGMPNLKTSFSCRIRY